MRCQVRSVPASKNLREVRSSTYSARVSFFSLRDQTAPARSTSGASNTTCSASGLLTSISTSAFLSRPRLLIA